MPFESTDSSRDLDAEAGGESAVVGAAVESSSSGGKEVWRRCEGTRAEEGLRRLDGGREAVWIDGRLRGRAMGAAEGGEAMVRVGRYV
jgi:hypothetical protein